MKTIIAVLFPGIVFSLGRAMLHMMQPTDKRAASGMSTAPAVRMGLSIVLVITLLVAAKMGLL